MAYIDRKSTEHRATTMLAVATFQAAAIFAVISGLAVTIGPKIADERLTSFNAPPPKLPPPPPSDPETHKKFQRNTTTQQTTTDNTDTELAKSTDSVFTETGTTLPPVGPFDFVETHVQPIVPGLTPKFAQPRGKTGDWATTADYPSRDLFEGNQGLVRYRLAIGADGRVTGCTITGTSGFPGLDMATCKTISKRARFEPATDSTGAKVAGTYSGSIRWVIPD